MYFMSRVHVERLLSREEAQDLAGESLLGFQKALPRIQVLPRYVRRMFRNNLIRHLTRKRARRMKECLQEDQLELVASHVPIEPETIGQGGLTDQDIHRLRISKQRLSEADHIMKTIWSCRLADEPLGYRQIGDILGMDEAALRMRYARFCRSVRKAVNRQERRQRHRSI